MSSEKRREYYEKNLHSVKSKYIQQKIKTLEQKQNNKEMLSMSDQKFLMKHKRYTQDDKQNDKMKNYIELRDALLKFIFEV